MPNHEVNLRSFSLFYNIDKVYNRKFLEAGLINCYDNFNRDTGNFQFDCVLSNILKDNNMFLACRKKLDELIRNWQVP